MKMIDMKRTKGENDGHKVGEEKYPYGLSISLDHHSLKKLGMHKKMPKVGEKLKLHAHAHVKGVHEDSEGNHRMELEMRHMAVEHGGEKAKDDGDEETNKGMKSAVDKALTKGEGSEDAGDGENE